MYKGQQKLNLKRKKSGLEGLLAIVGLDDGMYQYGKMEGESSNF